jgi:CMP-N-acetylneuraminic acid synthetase
MASSGEGRIKKRRQSLSTPASNVITEPPLNSLVSVWEMSQNAFKLFSVNSHTPSIYRTDFELARKKFKKSIALINPVP